MTINPIAKFLLQLPWFRQLTVSTEPVRAVTNFLVGFVTTAGAVLAVLIAQYPHSHYLILGASIVAAAASGLGIKVAGTVSRESVSSVVGLRDITARHAATQHLLAAPDPAPVEVDPALAAQLQAVLAASAPSNNPPLVAKRAPRTRK